MAQASKGTKMILTGLGSTAQAVKLADEAYQDTLSDLYCGLRVGVEK